MNTNIRQRAFLFFILLLCSPLFSQINLSKNTFVKNIGIGHFLPLKQKTRDAKLNKEIRHAIKLELKRYGYKPFLLESSTIKNFPNKQSRQDIYLLLGGQYHLDEKKGLRLYGQLHHPQNGYAVDALHVANTIEGLEGLNLPKGTHRNRKETIQLFAKRLTIRVRINPNRKEKFKRLRENISQLPILKNQNLSVRTSSQKKESKEAFKIFQETKVSSAARKMQSLEEAPSNVTVITSQMIQQRGYLTMTELLQDVSFIDFQTFHDSGEFPTHFLLRGQGDVGQTKVLMMENGIVQNDINFGWSRNLQYNISFLDVERVEIIQGPASALYGANAYVGVINVITKERNSFSERKDNANTYFELQSLYGSNQIKEPIGSFAQTQNAPHFQEKKFTQTKSIEGSFAYKFREDGMLRITLRHFKTDGDQGYARPDPGHYFTNNYEPQTVQTASPYGVVQNDRESNGKTSRLRDGFSTSKDNTFLRSRLEIGNYFTGLTYWKKSDGMGSYVPGYEYFTNTPGKRYQVNHQGYTVYAGHKIQATRKFFTMNRIYYRGNSIRPDTGFIYTYRFQDINKPLANDGTLLPAQPDLCKCYFAEGNLVGLESQFNYKLFAGNEITSGVQIEHSQTQDFGISLGEPQAYGSNTTPNSFSDSTPFFTNKNSKVFYNTTGGFFFQDEQRFLQNYVSTLGFRYDEFTNVAGADRVRFQGRTVSDGVFTPRIVLTGNPWRPVYFKLLYGESFKSPTNFQLFDEFRGNTNLKPQQNKTYESILIYKFRKLGRVKLNYFFSELQEVIDEKVNDGTVTIGAEGQHENFYQNIAATHIYGGSILAEINIKKNIFIFTEYNYTADRDPATPLEISVDQNSKQITKVSFLDDGKEIDNIAMHKANIGFNYLLLNKVNINMRLNWVGRRKAPKSNKYFQPYDLEFAQNNYPYMTEGTPDGYMSGYTLVNLTVIWKDWFGVKKLNPQIIVRNLFDKKYAGMGRQSGAGVRPTDELQSSIQNPKGFIPAYHPQPRRQIYFRLNYRF